MAAPSLTLEVLIATCGPDGGRKVEAMDLPEIPQVSYLVSWQNSRDEEIPSSLAVREDVRVTRLDGIGLSRNRNNCLDHAKGDILLIADDDLVLYPEGLSAILKVFGENPRLDYGSFMYDSDVPKTYPVKETSLARLPKYFYQTSFEIALRRDSKAGQLRFPENFGLGAGYFTAGEEELLLKKARRNCLECRFFPIKIALHKGPTTGVMPRLADGAIRARGALTAVENPLTWPARILLGSWRIWRAGQASFPTAFRLMAVGAVRAVFCNDVKPYLGSPI